MIRFTAKHLSERARIRGKAYEEDILSRVKFLQDGTMEMEESEATDVATKWAVTRALKFPPTPDQAGRIPPGFLGHYKEWADAGFPVLTTIEHQRRLDTCSQCPDIHCRETCRATPILRWLKTVSAVAPHCLWVDTGD